MDEVDDCDRGDHGDSTAMRDAPSAAPPLELPPALSLDASAPSSTPAAAAAAKPPSKRPLTLSTTVRHRHKYVTIEFISKVGTGRQ